MRRSLIVLIAVVLLALPLVASAHTTLFSHTHNIAVLGGVAEFGLYKSSDTTNPRNFIGYVAFQDLGNGNYAVNGDVPNKVWIRVVWRAVTPPSKEDKNAGRRMRIRVSSSADPKCDEPRKKGQPDGVELFRSSDNGLELTGQHYVSKVESIGFWFEVAGKKDEIGVSKLIVVPVTPVSVNEWIENPGGNTVSQLGGKSTIVDPGVQNRPQVNLDEILNQKPVVNEPDRRIYDENKPIKAEIDVKGKTLTVELVTKDGKPFRGEAVIWVTASDITAQRSVRSGKVLKDGKWIPTDAVLTFDSSYYHRFTVEAVGFDHFELQGDSVVLYGKN